MRYLFLYGENMYVGQGFFIKKKKLRQHMVSLMTNSALINNILA
jgi:hypothetical protein